MLERSLENHRSVAPLSAHSTQWVSPAVSGFSGQRTRSEGILGDPPIKYWFTARFLPQKLHIWNGKVKGVTSLLLVREWKPFPSHGKLGEEVLLGKKFAALQLGQFVTCYGWGTAACSVTTWCLHFKPLHRPSGPHHRWGDREPCLVAN